MERADAVAGLAAAAGGGLVGQHVDASLEASVIAPVQVFNAKGQSPFVLACDHASNRIPEPYGDLGLTSHQRLMHIAWDPGALAVALRLVDLLDAPLVASTVSRLVIDCNREESAPDLIPLLSERTEIPGNFEIDAAERQRRITQYHTPFHNALEALLGRRKQAGMETVLVTVHSFTPVYKDVQRPWPIGLIHPRDEGFTRALSDALKADDPGLNVGWNEPYSALNGVTYTLEHHSDRRGFAATMIEIRNNEILEPDGVASWAARLARCLETARGALGKAAA
ncbi:N-formylglutamate amidohydrolase [Devosia sp.]|uniref:N-formylglutamate amidohydrolase n=1 Tax=Devosia sp. TaxID=1871048 RepID=UPI003BAD6676